MQISTFGWRKLAVTCSRKCLYPQPIPRCQKVRHNIKYSDWQCHRSVWVSVNYKSFPDLENESCGGLLLGAFSSPHPLFILLTSHRSDVDWALAPAHTHTSEEHPLSLPFPTVWSQHRSLGSAQTLLVLPGHPYFQHLSGPASPLQHHCHHLNTSR